MSEGSAVRMKVTKATPEGFVVGIEGDTGRMTSQEFVATVDNAVKTFLADSKSAPKRENILDNPELAAAVREGFEGNGPAKAYALGYAAGQREGAQTCAALAGTGDAALAGLKEWIVARFADEDWSSNTQVLLIISEIDKRLGGRVR